MRKNYIDIAKGIGIILVVLGHLTDYNQIIRDFIYSFHRPLFFLLSGAFAKTDIPFREYLKKNLKQLYLPYFSFVCLDIILSLLLKGFTLKSLLSFAGFTFNIINRPLWFLFALFVIRTVFYFLDKNKYIKYAFGLICVAFVFVGSFLTLPENWVYIMLVPGFAFYIAGNVLKPVLTNLDKYVHKYIYVYITAGIAAAALLVFTAHINGSVDMTSYNYGYAYLYFINAVLGCFAVLVLSCFLSKVKALSKPLEFFGKNSTVILVFHFYITRQIVPRVFNYLNLSEYLYSPVVEVLLLLVIMLLFVPVIITANKYFYFIFGRKKPQLDRAKVAAES